MPAHVPATPRSCARRCESSTSSSGPRTRIYLTSPSTVRDYLRLRLAEREAEVFCVMFLTNRHRVIAFEEMFQGTIDGASVHPREVVKAALRLNAAAVILAHNHPSGVAEPSRSTRPSPAG
jgi:DNA repair protein RadC